MTSENKIRNIGIALSGGGVRAAVFHAGVMRWLAAKGLLGDVIHISTVSGGSLFAGLVFHFADYKWPTSQQYVEVVFPKIKTLLTSKSIELDGLKAFFTNPRNWKFASSRANLLASVIRTEWGIGGVLGDIPDHPIWSINATTAENGTRFRFKGKTGGDYQIGYAAMKNFPLAEAMAVSAAFPIGIGPLVINTKDYSWHKKDEWESEATEQAIIPTFDQMFLYDGGVYDNLGMEPLFDVGKREFKSSAGVIDHIIVSDAGAPLGRQAAALLSKPMRMKRVYDITTSC